MFAIIYVEPESVALVLFFSVEALDVSCNGTHDPVFQTLREIHFLLVVFVAICLVFPCGSEDDDQQDTGEYCENADDIDCRFSRCDNDCASSDKEDK